MRLQRVQKRRLMREQSATSGTSPKKANSGASSPPSKPPPQPPGKPRSQMGPLERHGRAKLAAPPGTPQQKLTMVPRDSGSFPQGISLIDVPGNDEDQYADLPTD